MRRSRRFLTHPLFASAKTLPTSSGVYVMKDAAGQVLYVGKAVNLRARVRSYFQGHDDRPRIPEMMRALNTLEVSLTTDGREALLLEAQLIRQYQPRFNVALKGLSKAVFLRIDPRERFPRLERINVAPDGARYFGPLRSAWHARATLEVLTEHFPLRRCETKNLRSRRRPCLEFQLRRCWGPCAGQVTEATYLERVELLLNVLEKGDTGVTDLLRKDMEEASRELRFEHAAHLRDRLKALEGAMTLAPPMPGPDRDVLALARASNRVALVVLPVRWGRQQEARRFLFDDSAASLEDLLETLLLQLYEGKDDVPACIVLPFALPLHAELEAILSERAGATVVLRLPPDEAGLEQVARESADAELKLTQGAPLEEAAQATPKATSHPQASEKARNARAKKPPRRSRR